MLTNSNPGNHEFDKGPELLADMLDKLTMPILCTNIDVSREPRLERIPGWGTQVRKDPRVGTPEDGDPRGWGSQRMGIPEGGDPGRDLF